MSLTFLPSLKHLAAVKVALLACNDDIFYVLNELILREEKKASFPMITDEDDDVLIRRATIQNEVISSDIDFYRSVDKMISKSKLKAGEKLSELLPISLQKLVVRILQPLVAQVYFWVRDHFFMIKHIEKTHCKNSWSWKLEGTIDRTKTAKHLIGNKSIDMKVRFVMACIYFLENDIIHLWQSMEESERKCVLSIDSNITVQFWMKWLEEETRPPWTQFASNFMDINNVKFDYYHIRLSLFFAELNTSSQWLFVENLWPQHVHVDDLRLCYSLFDEIERNEFCQAGYLSHLLCCYLDWPLQSIFFDVVNQVWVHLTASCFEEILRFVVHKKLVIGMHDFDYLQLLKDLWGLIPDTDKVEIQQKKLFTFVRAAIDYDEETHPLSIVELLEECRKINEKVEREEFEIFLSMMEHSDDESSS